MYCGERRSLVLSRFAQRLCAAHSSSTWDGWAVRHRRAAAPPPRRCGRKDHWRETAPQDDKQASVSVFYCSSAERNRNGGKEAFEHWDFRTGTLEMRRPACASETTSNASKKSDFSGWLVFTREPTKATFLASYLGWDRIVQGCLALDSPPKQTVEQSSQ